MALARCNAYGAEFTQTLEQVLKVLDASVSRGSHVLLKPNLISAAVPLACTEGAVVFQVAEWFLAQGAKVVVGDSPAFGSAAAGLQRLGMSRGLRSMGVAVRNFDRVQKVRLPSGRRAGVAADALECDLLVNLPRLKAHAQTRITAAVKNCFGCLVGPRKAWWHMAHGGKNGAFAGLLVELLDILPPTLTLADGIRAMHVTGPLHGESCSLGFIAAGFNPVAVDSAVLEVLGIDPATCPLADQAREKGIPGSSAAHIRYPLLHASDLDGTPFIPPTQLNPIRFSLFRFMKSSIKRVLQAIRSGHTA